MFQQDFEIKEGFLWEEERRRKEAKRWNSKETVGLVAGSQSF